MGKCLVIVGYCWVTVPMLSSGKHLDNQLFNNSLPLNMSSLARSGRGKEFDSFLKLTYWSSIKFYWPLTNKIIPAEFESTRNYLEDIKVIAINSFFTTNIEFAAALRDFKAIFLISLVYSVPFYQPNLVDVKWKKYLLVVLFGVQNFELRSYL